MKDIPYSVLKEDGRGYEILTLRDQYNNTFADIAGEYGITPIRARQIYSRMKQRQISLYIRHISIALGYESTAEIRKDFSAANECYQEFSYACAYLEKKYKNILDEYRAGEPGIPAQFIESLPPFKRELSKKTISRIVEMREIEKATFLAIARELHITPEKAKHTYDAFYHRQVLAYVETLEKQAVSQDEKRAIWRRYWGGNKSAKKRYEMILEEKRQLESN